MHVCCKEVSRSFFPSIAYERVGFFLSVCCFVTRASWWENSKLIIKVAAGKSKCLWVDLIINWSVFFLQISAVRAVVPNKSNNEIVLVLQHFENCVDKAVQAFLEGMTFPFVLNLKVNNDCSKAIIIYRPQTQKFLCHLTQILQQRLRVWPSYLRVCTSTSLCMWAVFETWPLRTAFLFFFPPSCLFIPGMLGMPERHSHTWQM